MKKTPIIVTVVVILFMGLGFLLYKVSPPPASALDVKTFDLKEVKDVSEPRAVEEDDHILGNKDAKNVMVIYEDLQCPVCKNFEPILERIPEALKDTKVVFRHYPLYPNPHPNSMAAAYAAEAAAEHGKFWEYVSLMYKHQEDWASLKNPLDKFAELAVLAGITDIEKFKNDIVNSSNSEKIKKDYFEALGLKAGGTPSLYFNGKPIGYTSDLASIQRAAETMYK